MKHLLGVEGLGREEVAETVSLAPGTHARFLMFLVPEARVRHRARCGHPPMALVPATAGPSGEDGAGLPRC